MRPDRFGVDRRGSGEGRAPGVGGLVGDPEQGAVEVCLVDGEPERGFREEQEDLEISASSATSQSSARMTVIPGPDSNPGPPGGTASPGSTPRPASTARSPAPRTNVMQPGTPNGVGPWSIQSSPDTCPPAWPFPKAAVHGDQWAGSSIFGLAARPGDPGSRLDAKPDVITVASDARWPLSAMFAGRGLLKEFSLIRAG
ncbi:MAG: hypothetical protein ACRDNS_17280, partial [Trebonia sp.]